MQSLWFRVFIALLLFCGSVPVRGNAGSGLTAQLTPAALSSAPAALQPAAAQKVYYENTIQNIIAARCARCHSGVSRNLSDFDNVKAYADSGMLRSMVSPGGPMSRFAGSDGATLLAWVDGGAPEKPDVAAVNWAPAGGPFSLRGPLGRKPFPVDVPLNRITYDNTIKFIVARDCLECHSSQFRNLTTYKNIKFYVDNGLLKTLVSPGGQMHRFAGPDTRYFLSWINNKAPQ